MNSLLKLCNFSQTMGNSLIWCVFTGSQYQERKLLLEFKFCYFASEKLALVRCHISLDFHKFFNHSLSNFKKLLMFNAVNPSGPV